LGHPENVTVETVTGIVSDEPAEVYTLTIEGDPTYIAGGIIVHNCPRCAALDGASWDLDGEPIDGNKIKWIGGPPLHHNDRCILSPIAKDTLGLGLDKSPDRASSLGPITGDTSFQGYFKRLTVEQQNEQFGEARAQLMRAGKITIRDLISGTGRELTLDELRAL